jgi:ABC-type multidrug transport system fused ATPase/permease subunit
VTRQWAVLAGLLAALAVLAPAASAKERVLTLYSPRIDSQPYVHDTHQVPLRANGREAPAKPGYILGYKEMALVDSKRPDAKPLRVPAGRIVFRDVSFAYPVEHEDGSKGSSRSQVLNEIDFEVVPGEVVRCSSLTMPFTTHSFRRPKKKISCALSGWLR